MRTLLLLTALWSWSNADVGAAPPCCCEVCDCGCIATGMCTCNVEIRELEVDLLETNTVRQEDGSVRFSQVIAWDRAPHDEAIDRGYKVVKEGYPTVHPYGDKFRVVWWCGIEKCYVLTAHSHLHTETTFDREAKFREYGGWFRPCW